MLKYWQINAKGSGVLMMYMKKLIMTFLLLVLPLTAYAQEPIFWLSTEVRGNSYLDPSAVEAKMMEHFSNNGWNVVSATYDYGGEQRGGQIRLIAYLNFQQKTGSYGYSSPYYSHRETETRITGWLTIAATVQFPNGIVRTVSGTATNSKTVTLNSTSSYSWGNGCNYGSYSSSSSGTNVYEVQEAMKLDLLNRAAYDLIIKLNQLLNQWRTHNPKLFMGNQPTFSQNKYQSEQSQVPTFIITVPPGQKSPPIQIQLRP